MQFLVQVGDVVTFTLKETRGYQQRVIKTLEAGCLGVDESYSHNGLGRITVKDLEGNYGYAYEKRPGEMIFSDVEVLFLKVGRSPFGERLAGPFIQSSTKQRSLK